MTDVKLADITKIPAEEALDLADPAKIPVARPAADSEPVPERETAGEELLEQEEIPANNDERIEPPDEDFGYFTAHTPPLLGAALDGDPDTSMVSSLYLHLISEHDITYALGMEMREANTLHRNLHEADPEIDHCSTDLRFRVRRSVDAVMAEVELQHALHTGQLTRDLHINDVASDITTDVATDDVATDDDVTNESASNPS